MKTEPGTYLREPITKVSIWYNGRSLGVHYYSNMVELLAYLYRIYGDDKCYLMNNDKETTLFINGEIKLIATRQL